MHVKTISYLHKLHVTANELIDVIENFPSKCDCHPNYAHNNIRLVKVKSRHHPHNS